MCSLCGALGKGPAWEHANLMGESARWQLRREAISTARHVSAMLAASRIKVTANPDHGFIVAFPTGATEIVGSLGDIWHTLARRGVAIPDPLAA